MMIAKRIKSYLNGAPKTPDVQVFDAALKARIHENGKFAVRIIRAGGVVRVL